MAILGSRPISYSYPERDVAGGAFASEGTKSKLADDFNEEIILTLDDAEDFRAQLEKEAAAEVQRCQLLALPVRIPTGTAESGSGSKPMPPSETPIRAARSTKLAHRHQEC